MKQAVWSGTINFGLVSIPVKLYPATEPKDVRFHLYDRRTGKRVHYERVTREYEPPTFTPEPPSAPEPYEHESVTSREPTTTEREREIFADRDEEERDEEEPEEEEPQRSRSIGTSDVVRGIELPTGDFVTVDEDELRSLVPERSRTIDIEEFVDLAEIDPVFFEKSYYVAPQWNSGAEKPYGLLLKAMQSAGMVGIGRFVLRTKPHLVAIRPLEKVLGLETLYFADEVRNPEDLARLPQVTVSERELKMAQQLIGTLATEWIADKHADEYRQGLLDLLHAKPASERAPEAEAAPPPVADLMAKLKASVEAAKRKNETARRTAKRLG